MVASAHHDVDVLAEIAVGVGLDRLLDYPSWVGPGIGLGHAGLLAPACEDKNGEEGKRQKSISVCFPRASTRTCPLVDMPRQRPIRCVFGWSE